MRVLIANRGEVAVRIIRCCQELGLRSILLHSTPDRNTSAYRMADEVIEIPGSSPAETYLNIPKVINACELSRADLLHPGFGFLSENADFVETLEKTKTIFVGPTSRAIRLAGNKIQAKALAVKAGVPVTPAYTGTETDPKRLLNEAKKIGFPCIVKAASGGGGKGMKVVTRLEDFEELLSSAKREALNAFGNEQIFIEKYLERPRHVEVQIFADHKGGFFHFFERDCSVQRRHQKIFEESPSISLSQDLRKKLTESALKIIKACSYTNAGTVEFLVDDKDEFYFMELNTRLQVEHTVTELVCGVDLVKLQLASAMRKPLNLRQETIVQRGHAMEVRIYAEDPANQFLPSTGKIIFMNLPLGPFRRFDFGYDEGDEVSPYYDPMLGKIITWAETREENIARMLATLSGTVIFGVNTNIEFLKATLQNKRFIQNNISTRFLEEEFPAGFSNSPLSLEQEKIKARLHNSVTDGGSADGLASNYSSPWVRE